MPVVETIKGFCIYLITNEVNGKMYIGMSKSPRRRWIQHKNAARKGKPQPICRAIKKYGEELFSFEILESGLSYVECCHKEIRLINAYNLREGKFGYNIAVGGCRIYFAKPKPPLKRIVRRIYCIETGKEYATTSEAAKDLGICIKGVQRVLAKKYNKCLGYTFVFAEDKDKPVIYKDRSKAGYTEEYRKKVGRQLKAYWVEHPETVKRRGKMVKCHETGEVFDSVKALSDSGDFALSSLHRHLRGETNKYRGLTFSYLED